MLLAFQTVPPSALLNNPYVGHIGKSLQKCCEMDEFVVIQLSFEWANANEVAVVSLVLLGGVVNDNDLLERVTAPADLLQILDPVMFVGVAVMSDRASLSGPKKFETIDGAKQLRGNTFGVVRR